MQRYQDVILNSNGQPVSAATVLVKPTGGASTSTLYGDVQGTATRTNPLTADVNGRFWFYAPNGRYDLVVSGSYITPTTASDIMLEDVPLSNLSELSTSSAARTNLGLGSAATHPASDFVLSTATSSYMIGSNNLSEITTASVARTNLGLGSAAIASTAAFLQPQNNLSDITTASAARTSLGLGSAALLSTASFLQATNNLSDITTAAAARANLGVAIGTNVQAYSTAIAFTTATNVFGPAQRGASVVLTSTNSSITMDIGTANHFTCTVTQNTTMATPTNVGAVQSGIIVFTIGGTARTFAASSYWHNTVSGSTATFSTASGAVDIMTYVAYSTAAALYTMFNNI